jgi:F-type H+-transporting ATPase subunit b
MGVTPAMQNYRRFLPALFLASLLISVCISVSPLAHAQAAAASPEHSQASSGASGEPAMESSEGKGGKGEKAESGEDEQAQFKHSGSVQWVARVTGLSLDKAYWLCVLINFAVIAAAVFYFSKKNLPSLFSNRTATIQKAMQEARQASDEANRRLAEIENRLSRLSAEIVGMKETAEKEAVAEEARIKAAAEEDARKIVESAEQEIAAAAKSARRELTTYAANLAVSLAARQIKVDTATDQALVRGFASELSPKTKSKQDGN